MSGSGSTYRLGDIGNVEERIDETALSYTLLVLRVDTVKFHSAPEHLRTFSGIAEDRNSPRVRAGEFGQALSLI